MDTQPASLTVTTTHFTAFEAKLYLFLWTNRERLVSKAEIEAHMYPFKEGFAPSSNVIEVFVKRLRRKGLIIETVKGRGYRLLTSDSCLHKCDVCDKRPAIRKLIVAGIETAVCDECQGPKAN